MHTYREMNKGVWTVGFEKTVDAAHPFRPMRDFKREVVAAAYTSFLNGGQADHLFTWTDE